MGENVSYFQINGIENNFGCKEEVCDLLDNAFEIFKDNLNSYYSEYDAKYNRKLFSAAEPKIHETKIVLDVEVNSTLTWLSLGIDESYTLSVHILDDDVFIKIFAQTYFGARHGLETLTQLISFEETLDSLMIINSVDIKDSPAFTYRGLLLDTARNFIPVTDIERTLDGMASTKLNTFHWHISDTQSFPLYVESQPNMSFYGAYSVNEIYSQKDVKHLIEYARIRGIRILPEIDAPAHVGNGFQWTSEAGLGDLIVCYNKVNVN